MISALAYAINSSLTPATSGNTDCSAKKHNLIIPTQQQPLIKNNDILAELISGLSKILTVPEADASENATINLSKCILTYNDLFGQNVEILNEWSILKFIISTDRQFLPLLISLPHPDSHWNTERTYQENLAEFNHPKYDRAKEWVKKNGRLAGCILYQDDPFLADLRTRAINWCALAAVYIQQMGEPKEFTEKNQKKNLKFLIGKTIENIFDNCLQESINNDVTTGISFNKFMEPVNNILHRDLPLFADKLAKCKSKKDLDTTIKEINNTLESLASRYPGKKIPMPYASFVNILNNYDLSAPLKYEID
ncbi:MAG: hypothetical protein PHV30_05455 [Candidatus Margulisbacteria bacterium]|nr:hypothetical protein [Candidatus Margulisiibacteriota bacterium]